MFCKDQEWFGEDQKSETIAYKLLVTILEDYLTRVRDLLRYPYLSSTKLGQSLSCEYYFYDYHLVKQHSEVTEIVKPCIDGVKELWECGDEILERDANNVMTLCADNPEIVEDQTDTLIDKYLSGDEPGLICMYAIFKYLYCLH